MASNKVQFVANTYSGELEKGFLAATLLGADSVKRGLWTVMENVKFKEVILDIDDDIVIQEPSSLFTAQNTTPSQNETYLQPVAGEFMQQLDFSNLVSSWESRDMKAGAFGDYQAPTYLSDFMVGRYIPKIAQAMESLYYRGKAGTPQIQFNASYPGLFGRFETDNSVFKLNLKDYQVTISAIDATGLCTHNAPAGTFRTGDVVTLLNVTGSITESSFGTPQSLNGRSYRIAVGSQTTFKLIADYNNKEGRVNASFSGTATAAITQFINVSNVLPILGSVFAQINEADRQSEDLQWQIPYHVQYAYRTAQAERAINTLNAFPDKKSTDYDGMKLLGMNFWNANSIMIARKSNLFLGIDLLADDTDLQVKYLGDVTLDNFVRMKARMKSDTNYKFGNEILWLRPSTT